jgi:hypothetical protein
MGMIKLITPGAQDFSEPVAQMIKRSSRGLLGSDMDQFIKRASVQFRDKMASIQLHPGEVPVHLLAVGATESYGPNRNGDGFRRDVCREYYPTFEKYARWYRHHQNKDPSKSYGTIKMAAFNEPMDRIELLVALNSTQEAADRNGGLVADQEMEKLSSGDDIAVSMACRVSHDICSGCGNKAKTREDYCGPEMCKYGGLKDNIAKVFEDGHQLHADNPDPGYFDISQVFRPADRIGYVLGKAAGYEQMLKAASVEGPISGAEWAERLGVSSPLWMLAEGPWADRQLVGQLKVAQQMLDLETTQSNAAPNPMDRACGGAAHAPANDMPDVRGVEKLGSVLAALSECNCMLPVRDFINLMSADRGVKAASVADEVATRLPGIYNRLVSDPSFENRLRDNPYTPANVAPRRLRHWALKHASAWSMDRQRVVERLQRSVIRGTDQPKQRSLVKVAHVSQADALAEEYAFYQLAFLHSQQNSAEPVLTAELAMRHNYIQ